MINYIEEINPGDAFEYDGQYYIVTSDFTKDSRICYSLSTGFVRHFKNATIINKAKLLTIDPENNIVPIKEDKNENP